MPKDYFGEPVAERYDESTGEMSGPTTVDPVVDFLVDLCFDGSCSGAWHWHRPDRLTAVATRHPRTWHRFVGGDGRKAAGETRRQIGSA